MNDKKTKRLKMGSVVVNNKQYPIYKGVNLIGRIKEATVIIKNTEISHRHALLIILDENSQYISDFGSSNGVYVGGIRLVPNELCKITSSSIMKLSTLNFTFIKESNIMEETILNKMNTQEDESLYTAKTQFIDDSSEIPDDGFDFSVVNTQLFHDRTEDKTSGVESAGVDTAIYEAATQISKVHELTTPVNGNHTLGPITQAINEELDRMQEFSEMCTQIVSCNNSIYEAQTQLNQSTPVKNALNINDKNNGDDNTNNEKEVNKNPENKNAYDETMASVSTDTGKEVNINCGDESTDNEKGENENKGDENTDDEKVACETSDNGKEIHRKCGYESTHSEIDENKRKGDEETDDENGANYTDRSFANGKDENKDKGDESTDDEKGVTNADLSSGNGKEINNDFTDECKDNEKEVSIIPDDIPIVQDSDPQSQLHLSQLTRKVKHLLMSDDEDELQECEDKSTKSAVIEESQDDIQDDEDEVYNYLQDNSNENECKSNKAEDDYITEAKDDEDKVKGGKSNDGSGCDSYLESNDEEESFVRRRVSFMDSSDTIIPETQEYNDSCRPSTSRATNLNLSDIIPSSQDMSSAEFSLRITPSSSNEEKLTTIAEKSDKSPVCEDDDDIIESDDEMNFAPMLKPMEDIQRDAAMNVINSTNDDEDVICETDTFDYAAPTQNVAFDQKSSDNEVARTETEFDFNAATQKVPILLDDAESGDDVDYMGPTQKVPSLQGNVDSDDDLDYVGPTQQICSESIFAVPTQKIDLPKTDCDVEAPLQPLASKSSNNDEEFEFSAPTQKVFSASKSGNDTASFYDYDLPTQKIDVCEHEKLKAPTEDMILRTIIDISKESKDDVSDDEDFDYMAPTQKIFSKSPEPIKTKETDVNTSTKQLASNELAKTQPISEPEDMAQNGAKTANVQVTQETKLEELTSKAGNMTQNHAIAAKVQVESQLEVMFETQNVRYEESTDERPSNPLVSVLIQEATTQDVVNALDSDSVEKTANKRLSDSEPDLEKPAKRPKENPPPKRVTRMSAMINVDSKEAFKPKDDNKVAVASPSNLFNKLSMKRATSSDNKTTSDDELTDDEDFKKNSDEEVKIDRQIIELDDETTGDTVIVLEENSREKLEDDDDLNKSASKVRRKTHALEDDDLLSQNVASSSSKVEVVKKPPQRASRGRKRSESSTTSLYVINLDNPDVTDFEESTVKQVKRRKSEANDMLKSLDSVLVEGKRRTRNLNRKVVKIEEEESSDEDSGKITFTVPKKQPPLKISDVEDGETKIEEVKPKVLKKRGRKPKNIVESIHNTSDMNVSVASRFKRNLKPKICFTMCNDPHLETIIRTLGGSVIDSIDKCTVLVTKQVQRTMKLLMAIGQRIPICSPNWIEDSKKNGSFLDPWDHLIVDQEAETKWSFSLKESFNRADQRKLFAGHSFLLQVSIPVEVLKGAIEGSGGKVISRISKTGKCVVVSTQENRKKYEKYLKQDVLIVSTEAIFDGVLRQEIVFEKHLLK